MKTELFDYALPPELIAQTPLPERDASRLMVLIREREGKTRAEHAHFRDLPLYLRPGDLLVLNDTKVMPARLLGRKEGTGARIEVLLLRPHVEEAQSLDGYLWEILLRPAKRLKPGQTAVFGDGRLRGTVTGAAENGQDGRRLMSFVADGAWEEVLAEAGRVPLPPYIREELADKERYQTVYARESGSAAAPTAGLHFTPALLEALHRGGVETRKILLHVGLGTFRPVQAETVEDHVMHSEYFRVEPETAAAIRRAKVEGRRVVAAGTTVARTLEAAAARTGMAEAGEGRTDIFIYPGFRFRVVDALITNFHFPRSTLLMLVSAFAGRENVLAAYEEAVRLRYRFYSLGDAMLLL
ncbi:MAG: tRNA preQ1(34) S-adenosylmethionine ribosyltransferase-isomerase QueA [Gracilibacteraceae bacterium]|jgi:S-adenosylmethionine:tRNA ribosyltransferase-isomerase|nr:tRNA preQ1(34) S-adenosylmethionine ribosyltransferase-isomerase QueA [Gracilibacteraceae bacterium]